MWNPFARRPDDGLDDEPIVAAEPTRMVAPPANSRLADVRVMGEVAIATVAVTVISQDAGVDMLAELLVDLEETGARHFILDIQNVEYMDSACLGCLVESLNRLARQGGRIALVNPAHRVHYLFKLTRLDRVFRICPDVMAALEAVDRAA